MKFNLKSKLGFTLIELLVVIGILAVLAAIAIPSVAGLIDRANQSADQTNASEMTNAMERFVSEYELYRQDIMSNKIDFDNLDSAQGRVYNVTGAKSIEDIKTLESEVGLNGIRINIDNKYAQNHQTAKVIIENYMKTSSSTFEPKQSDMTYWYNTVTGYTVVAEKNVNTAILETLLPQKIKYGNQQSSSLVEWIDLSSDIEIPDIKTINILKRTTLNGYRKINFWFATPNKKYFNEFDFDNTYLLYGLTKDGIVDINNNIFSESFSDMFTEANNDRLENSEEYFIEWHLPIKIPEESLNEDYSFRLAYKYIEDGNERYIYSSTFIGNFNDLPVDTKTTLPNYE